MTGIDDPSAHALKPRRRQIPTAFSDGTIRAYIAGMGGLTVWRSDDDGQSWTEEGQQFMPGADPSLIQTGDQEWTLFNKTFEPQGSGPPNP